MALNFGFMLHEVSTRLIAQSFEPDAAREIGIWLLDLVFDGHRGDQGVAYPLADEVEVGESSFSPSTFHANFVLPAGGVQQPCYLIPRSTNTRYAAYAIYGHIFVCRGRYLPLRRRGAEIFADVYFAQLTL